LIYEGGGIEGMRGGRSCSPGNQREMWFSKCSVGGEGILIGNQKQLLEKLSE